MLRYKEYRLNETSAVAPDNSNQEIIDTINKMVDAWVYDLKKSLLTGTGEGQRGVWDRFKNWMSNMWHGRYKAENPYMWNNKLGDTLGAKTESYLINPNEFNLNEYRSLKSICDSLEECLNEAVPQDVQNPPQGPPEIVGTEKLKLVNIINQKAQELKTGLQQILLAKKPTVAPVAPNIAPEAPKTAAPVDNTPDDTAYYSGLLDKALHHGHIDPKYHRQLKSKLESDNENDVKDAVSQIDALVHGNKTVAPTTPEPASAAPVEKPDDGSFSFVKPPTINKKWEQLNPVEKEAWNFYGGGESTRRHRVSGVADDKAVSLKLPWILRLGDPRREIYRHLDIHRKTEEGEKERKSPFWAHLTRMGRIEDEKDPVKSEQDLKNRIKEINKKIEEKGRRKDEVPPTPTAPTSPVTSNTPAPVVSKPAPPPVPKPKPTHPAPFSRRLDSRDKPILAPMDTSDITATKHTDDNALGKPAHKKIDEPKNEPVSDLEKPKDEPKSSNEKEEIKTKIEAMTDKVAKKELSKLLDKASSPDELKHILDMLKLYEENWD